MELYNVLKKQSESLNINSIDTTKLQESINLFDEEGQKMVYALLKYDFTLQNNKHTLPYSGKLLKDGRLKFDFNEFSETLIKILYLFVNKHSEKINDEKTKREHNSI